MMMPSFITETVSAWDYLHDTELPIFIYGMGDGAMKILRVCEQYSIPIAGFFASDEFVRGHSFAGHLVHSLSQIEMLVDEFVVVLAFGAGYPSLYKRIEEIAEKHILLAPDVPVYGDGLFTPQYVEEHSEEILSVYDMLGDELSKKTYANVINYKISGKISYLTDCTEDEENIYENIIKLTDSETYIDMGAYNGDTVESFCRRTNGMYDKIYALEPDSRNFRKLTKSTEETERIHLFNAAAWNEDTLLYFADKSGRQSTVNPQKESKMKEVAALRGDSLTENATFIKMDVEGAEKQAIEGCAKSIENGSKLAIALYHRNEDIFSIPLQIRKLNPDYKLYIRHMLYIPAWETNLYCCL